ncbi:LANO_0E12838g1_1 [Lachancea nothofagi CBS 11611]|uniref:LANO_0E12838g1_1 n=1 Tax=Lachancea nothofagi CBS 11611 TaxID=1266666 RepID=A0A1G4JYQ0_9SACH|nr:LANO_0E12838g1_1 [Lachancea nothofagi CBS 11611]
MSLKVGYIPEHFATPLVFGEKKGFFKDQNVEVELVPFPSGSGHLIQSLNAGEIDVAIGLTEAFVRGIADTEKNTKPKYQIAGTFVKSSLEWCVSTGSKRDDLTDLKSLEGKKIGVSRIGSGSHVMSYVMALQLDFEKPFADFPVCNTFDKLRESVNSGESDAFMWEYYTSKKYLDSGEIKMLGHVASPWPSWVVVKRTDVDMKPFKGFINALNKGIDYFNKNKEEALDVITENFGYSHEDAANWFKTVKYHTDCGEINDLHGVVTGTLHILTTANVLENKDEMVVEDNMRDGTLTS